MGRLPPTIVQDMQITPLTRNMVFGTIEAADVLLEEKQSEE